MRFEVVKAASLLIRVLLDVTLHCWAGGSIISCATLGTSSAWRTVTREKDVFIENVGRGWWQVWSWWAWQQEGSSVPCCSTSTTYSNHVISIIVTFSIFLFWWVILYICCRFGSFIEFVLDCKPVREVQVAFVEDRPVAALWQLDLKEP